MNEANPNSNHQAIIDKYNNRPKTRTRILIFSVLGGASILLFSATMASIMLNGKFMDTLGTAAFYSSCVDSASKSKNKDIASPALASKYCQCVADNEEFKAYLRDVGKKAMTRSIASEDSDKKINKENEKYYDSKEFNSIVQTCYNSTFDIPKKDSNTK